MHANEMPYNNSCLRMRFFLYYGIMIIIMMMMMASDDNGFLMCSALSLSIGRNFRSAQQHQRQQGSSSFHRRIGEMSQSERQSLPPPQIKDTISSSCIPPVMLPIIEQQQCQATNRRAFLVQHAAAAAASATVCMSFAFPARAANLPQSTGADLSATGTVETLIPVVRLLDSLQTIKRILKTTGKSSSTTTQQVLTEVEKLARNVVPVDDEKAFKRIFDEYSQPVSYKQKFMDQNAFLVYYTQGYDGPNRPRLEEEQDGNNDDNISSSKQQTLQYGFRNDSWTAWNDFVAELDFAMKQTKQQQGSSSSSSSSSSSNSLDNDDVMADLLEPLNRTIDAVSAYVSLAPESDVKEAYKRV